MNAYYINAPNQCKNYVFFEYYTVFFVKFLIKLSLKELYVKSYLVFFHFFSLDIFVSKTVTFVT